MYCKKCKYYSFDHVSSCPKCGVDWEESRKALYLNWLTSPGFAWLSPAAPEPAAIKERRSPLTQPAPVAPPTASIPDKDNIFLESDSFIPPQPPIPPTQQDMGLDVGLLPELDLGTTAPAEPSSKISVASDEEIFLEDLAPAPLSAQTKNFASPKPAAPSTASQRSSASKPDDLFIPELEEMLAPLTDDFQPGKPKTDATKIDGDDDIILDFSAGQDDDIIVIEDPLGLETELSEKPKK